MGGAFGDASGYFLLRLGGVLLVFLPCLWAAIRRSRNDAPGSRLLGIVLAALVPMAGYPLYFGGLYLIAAPVLLFYVAYFVVIWIALPAIIAAVAADVILRLLGATRSLIWLVLSIAAALAATLLCFAWMFGSQFGFPAGFILDYAMLALIPASSALIWWANLPPVEEDVAGAFE